MGEKAGKDSPGRYADRSQHPQVSQPQGTLGGANGKTGGAQKPPAEKEPIQVK